jgi:hypothetical protein
MRIPRAFSLMGHRVTVEIVSKKDWPYEDALAIWLPQEYKIFILRKRKALMVHSFLHELMHAILDTLNHKLSRDEVFVDTVAGLLQQALETAE